MALSDFLKIGSQVAGAASAIPGFAPFAAPISAVLGVASNVVPQNNNVNTGAVDVTNQLKGTSLLNPSYLNYTYPAGTSNPIYTPQQPQNVGQPYGIEMYGSKLNPSQFPNMLPSGNLNVQGRGNSIDPNFDNNMQLPQDYNTIVDSSGNVTRPIKPAQQPTDTRAVKNALYGTDGTPSLLNWNRTMQTQGVTQQPSGQVSSTITAAGNQMDLIDKSVKSANIYNAIGQGISGVGPLLSIINEINKQPSEMMQAPQYRNVNMDSNQTTFINSNREQIDNAKNAQKRLYMDLGINPMVAGTMAENWASDQLLKVTAEAERTRQGIEANQAQINANIQGQANQIKAATDQFNIQKQMQENQLAGQNISQSLMTLAGSVIGLGQGNISNNLWGSMAKNSVIQSYIPTR